MRWHDDFDEFFERILKRMLEDIKTMSKYMSISERYWHIPEYNIEDAGDHYLIQVYLPGVNKEDIDLEADENNIYIKVEKKEEEKEKRGFSSRYYGIQMAIQLPQKIDLDKLEVQYNNGMLEIKAYKKEYSGK